MAQIVSPRVRVIAQTEFLPPQDIPWSTDADGGEALAEFAGRACYEAWEKTNPDTATNAGYLEHVIDVGHLSVLEHGSVSLYITGISRSVTHELVRHRHFSYSQLSPRYVPDQDSTFVEPDIIAEDPLLHQRFLAMVQASAENYAELLAGLEKKFIGDGASGANQLEPNQLQPNQLLWRKQARQAARAVLPNAVETRIVVTGNYRAWRHFIAMRATEHANVEIRALSIRCLRELAKVAKNVFADFTISALPDGTEVATSPKVSES